MSGTLPVTMIAKAAYKAVFHPFKSFLSRTWAWTLLIWAVTAVSSIASEMLLPWEGVAELLSTLLVIPLFAGLAITWHRTVQLGENAGGMQALHFQRREWRYIGVQFLLPMMVLAPSLLLVAVGAIIGEDHRLVLIAPAVILVGVFFYVLTRLALAFPLIAIDASHALGTSWRLMKGKLWRFFLTVFLTYTPISIFIGTLAPQAADTVHKGSFVLAFVIQGLLSLGYSIEVCLIAGTLSLTLMHLRGLNIEPAGGPASTA